MQAGMGSSNGTKKVSDADSRVEPALSGRNDSKALNAGQHAGVTVNSDLSYNVFQVFMTMTYAGFWARPLKRGPHGSLDAWGLLLFLVAQVFGTTYLMVRLNKQQGEFFTALSNKEEERFWNAVMTYFIIILVAIPVLALKEYTLNSLALLWRGWMSEHLLSLYFCHERAYFRLSSEAQHQHQREEQAILHSVDNPDQRIVSDVESFTTASLSFMVTFLGACLRVLSFGAILYDISGKLAVFLIVYAMFMTGAVTWLFGKRLAVLNYISRKCEADLRFALVRVRENAESIAMFAGGPRELRSTRSLLHALVHNNKQTLWVMFGYDSFQNSSQYITGFLPAVLVAPQYLAGQVEFGVVKQAQDAFYMLRYSLFIIANKTSEFSAFATGLDRLEQLVHAITEEGGEKTYHFVGDPDSEPLLGSEEPPAAPNPAQGEMREIGQGTRRAEGLELRDLDIAIPKTGRSLVKGLGLRLSPGESLLVMGPSGAGKTSVLRVLCGLWPAAAGEILAGSDTFFLPQRVYMPQGSLADCLCYPAAHPATTYGDHSKLVQALRSVGLERFEAAHLDSEADWAHTLSPGEQQRLSFARLLLRGSCGAVFLDEATSALDIKAEARLYTLLSSLTEVFVSVGHRETLVPFHTHVLLVGGEAARARWKLYTSKEYVALLSSGGVGGLDVDKALGEEGGGGEAQGQGPGSAPSVHQRKTAPHSLV